MRIFVTGGAGYIGTVLIPMLLDAGHEVTCFDSLLFENGDKAMPFISRKGFRFVRGDIRDKAQLAKHIKGHGVVIHLAALVGFPICRKLGDAMAHEVNTLGTQNVIDTMDEGAYLLFGSTGSNYGEIKGVCTEDTPLNPLTAYGFTKTAAEGLVLARSNSTAFRFATAFGASPRLRLDLLVNDLAYRAYTEGYAVIYESHFMRTFIHVRDIARVFLFAIDHRDQMSGVFNVGSDTMNFSKKQVCEEIGKLIPKAYFNYADVGEDADKRNYVVSYSKIKSLGFDTTVSLQEGIEELLRAFELVTIRSSYHNVYK